MRQYRAAKILLPQATYPTAAAAQAAAVRTEASVPLKAMVNSLVCDLGSQPHRSVHKLDGAREVVDKPESVAAAA
jgi:hypothetical protein